MASSLVGMAMVCLGGIPPSALGQLDRLLKPIEELQDNLTPNGIKPNSARRSGGEDRLLLGEQELLRQLRRQLAEQFSLHGDLEIDLCREWNPLPLPPEGGSVVISEFPREGVASSFLVRFKVVSGEKLLGEWQIALRARLWQEVWVAEVRLDRGQALDKSVVGSQKVDVLVNHNALLGTELNPAEFEMDQTLNVGQPIKRRDVIAKPVIRKNQIVEAVANRGAIAITMKAQALENGTAKALIKMRNLDSRKEFTAQVLDESHVSVLF
jgi:flagella basal body P-ring formation protein FlgA